MPVFCEFDTETVHSPACPDLDTRYTLGFPSPFDARPRLPHGFRKLEADKNANIRAESSLMYCTKTWADCHITTWGDSTLYGAIDDIFVLVPKDQDFLTGEHMRNLVVDPNDPASIRVNFERPLTTIPKHNWRLKTTATNIDRNGFTLSIESWDDTVLCAAQACWIAYPEHRERIFSTSVNTMEVRPKNQPRSQQSKGITFGNVKFSQNPKVFVALNYIDIDCNCKANLRINAHVSGVSGNGLTWHIDSWGDTTLYAAGACIMTFSE